MNDIDANVFTILSALYEGNHTALDPINVGELRRIAGLDEVGFDAADSHVRATGYVEGTMGGDQGSIWIVPAGISFVKTYESSHYALSGDARRLAMHGYKRPFGDHLSLAELEEELSWDHHRSQTAIAELGDWDLAQPVMMHPDTGIDGFALTKAGRLAARTGFKREPGASGSAGVAIYGPVSGSNILSAVNAIGSQSQQIVDQAADRHQLQEQLRDVLAQMLVVVEDYEGGAVAAEYKAAAEQFAHELSSANPNPSRVRRLLATLSVLGDTEGTLDLVGRLAPYWPILVDNAVQILAQHRG